MPTDLEKSAPLSVGIPDEAMSIAAIASALSGDWGKLPDVEKVKFYGKLCEFTGLNPLAKPFDWIVLSGKLMLYANKGCAEMLRKIHHVNVEIIERKFEHGCFVVRVKAVTPDGRIDEALAAVPFHDKMIGEAAAIAMMKCETKAKRRVTLSICSLGMLDESEVNNLPSAKSPSEAIAGNETAADLAAKLNDTLVEEKPRTIEAEVIVEKPAPEKVEEPPVEENPFPVESPAPAPITPAGQVSADDELWRNVAMVLSENPKSVDYLWKQGKLEKGKGVDTINRQFAEKIIRQSKQFLAAVETWVKGGCK